MSGGNADYSSFSLTELLILILGVSQITEGMIFEEVLVFDYFYYDIIEVYYATRKCFLMYVPLDSSSLGFSLW